MAVDFTDDQKKAIKAQGTVLVSAAAGSGKTAVLTERVVQRMADEENGISADRLLIVTFTNASALEMRVRISKRLDELCAEKPNNTHLLKQKLLLRSAKICTIDAYCIELVRNHFALLGVNPDFAIAEDSQTSAIKEACLNNVLSKRYEEKGESFNSLSLLFGLDSSDKSFSETVFKIHDYCMCMSQPEMWLKKAADGYSCADFDSCVYVPVILSHIKDILDSSAALLSFWINEIRGSEIEKSYLKGFTEGYERVATLSNLASDKENWDELYNGLSSFNINVAPAKNIENVYFKDLALGVKNAVKDRLNGLAKTMVGTKDAVVSDLATAKPTVEELAGVVLDFKKAYFEELNRRNLLTFSHIEQLALKLLCNEKDGKLVPSEISKEICKDFDEVLVDEYQDNNNLQDALFYALSDEGRHLFMVGDVKQSIYGFRNANPDNFLKHKDEYPLYDDSDPQPKSKVILKENFRSRDGVCEFVNAFCNTVMKKSTCGMDYTEEEELNPSAKYSEKETPDVKLLFNQVSSGEKREEIDAYYVADYIASLIKEPAFLKADKNDVSILRQAEYKDFAILLRSPGPRAKYYIDALKNKGIPVSYSSGDFYDSPEILTAISILKVIDNPTLDIPLLSAMMSSVYGFTPDDMAEIRSKNKGKTLYARVCSAANENERCSLFLKSISSLRVKAATLPVNRVLNEIFISTSLPEIMSASPEGTEVRDNLQRLITIAADFDSKNDSGIGGFIAEFERMSGASKNAGKASKSECNAVKIMSFHGSKGLQFPICIVADCGGNFNKMDITNQMILNEDYGIGLKFVDDDENTKSNSIARSALSLLQHKKMISEEIRLMYVAMTRAEEKLVISLSKDDIDKCILDCVADLSSNDDNTTAPATSVKSAKGYAEWIVMAALLQKNGQELCKDVGAVTEFSNGNAAFSYKVCKNNEVGSDKSTKIVVGSNEKESYSVNNELLQQIKERFSFEYKNEKISKVPSKMAVTQLVHGDSNKFAFTLRPEFMSKSGLTPAERGTAAHKFMQFADYNAAEASVKNEIERLAEWEFISSEEADALDVKKLEIFFASSVYNRIKKAVMLKREYKFMVEYPYEDDTTIVQGIADCIFEEPDGIVILDFKTDRVSDVNTLTELYKGQLEVYKYALEKILGKKVKVCILYSLHLGQEVKC